MDFDLSVDQKMLLSSVETLLSPYRTPKSGAHGYVQYSEALQNELTQSGFLEVASQPGFSLLDAALLVEEIASCPLSVEVAASAMISPLIGPCTAPLAMVWAFGAPTRYLSVAKTVCLFGEDVVFVGAPDPEAVEVLESTAAYPLAALWDMPREAVRIEGEKAAAIRRRALIGIAAEAAGLMRAALERTVHYAKDRHLFGQQLAEFQAVQHRLAEDAQLVHACRTLALRAAYEDEDASAASACLFAQDAMRKIIYDCHQFSGALGLTLEYPLHLWTYRLKYLQGEAGGRARQAELLAERVWS